MIFSSNYNDIIQQIENIDPVSYGVGRNYATGSVTKLSPYISRGVIATEDILKAVLKKGYKKNEIEIFIKELAWREYFQRVWSVKGNDINNDLKTPQQDIDNFKIPTAVVEHNTGIEAIDTAVKDLYNQGYLHNHLRMYLASICCNISKCHWRSPAQWMYYHLLDADWASNALSWQWIAGSFSSKKYYANQDNINKYFFTAQKETFLDYPYEKLVQQDVPEILRETTQPILKSNLPKVDPINLDENKPTCIYNFYNLDGNWMKEVDANRILLLEPSFFKEYPVGDKTIQFVIDLSKNIQNIQVVVAEFEEVFKSIPKEKLHFKEHPTNNHYRGISHDRSWIFKEVKGYYPSFSSYWKKCAPYLKHF